MVLQWMVASAALTAGAGEAREPPVVAAYYLASGDAAKAAAVPAERLTHVLYAFAPVCGDRARSAPPACRGLAEGTVVLPDDAGVQAELAAVKALKRRRPGLRILLSVGGWGMQAFPAIAASPERRAAFAGSLAGLMRAHPELDGVDVDWEYPGGGDAVRPPLAGEALARERADYTRLVREVRTALDGASREKGGRRLELTAAVSGAERVVAGTDWRAVAPLMTRVFVMTYDFGAGGPPGHHANLFARGGGEGSDAMVERLVAAGVPAAKLVLGLAFYAREWAADGRFVGTTPWRELDLPGQARRGWRTARDEAAGATYLSGPDGAFASYEDPAAICAKGRYAAGRGLGGLFAWQAAHDDGRLTAAMANAADGGCGGAFAAPAR